MSSGILINFAVRETKTTFLIFVMLATVLSASSSGPGQRGRVAGISAASAANLPVAPARAVIRPMPNAVLAPLELSARAVLVLDRQSDTVFYEKNIHEQVPIASLTKLLTAVLVSRLVPQEKIVEVAGEDLRVPQPRAELSIGERITINELLQAMLISSANDATMALARTTGGTIENFVAMMNEYARRLGMRDSAFTNPVGFDQEGHYSTASDLSKLVDEFLTYPRLLDIVKTKIATVVSANGKRQHRLVTTNQLLESHQEVLGLKTGYTENAKGSLIILVDQSLSDTPAPAQYYYIILGSDNREREGQEVLAWIKDNFTWTP